MSQIVWLASYPRSGNTWFRVFIANLLRSEEVGPVPINDLWKGGIASGRWSFDEYAGVDSAELTPDEIERLRPPIYEQWVADAKDDLYVKIHDAYHLTSAGRPLVPAGASRGALYFLRNPLDVAGSYAHHLGAPPAAAIERMGDEGHCSSARADRLHVQLRQRLLTWSGHVESWVDQKEVDVLVVRYEDMHEKEVETFTEAARFAGLPSEPHRIAVALERSRFDELQRQERIGGFAERSAKAESFFRKGRMGSWREELSAEEARRVVDDHRAVMERFGYLDASGSPVY